MGLGLWGQKGVHESFAESCLTTLLLWDILDLQLTWGGELLALDLHAWDLTPKEAFAVQRLLCTRVSSANHVSRVQTVAGVDISVKAGTARAAIAVLSLPDLELQSAVTADAPITFPYIPGLLAFREVPAILRAVENLRDVPDVFLVDGHGLAHPRSLGLASHLGLILDHPTVGCAKSLLVGSHATLGDGRGDRADLVVDGQVVGAAVRTRVGVRPVYVSVGHNIDLATAVELILRCCQRWRLPEPIRWAHRIAGESLSPVQPYHSLWS